jgi:hypothetical protein
MIDSTVLHCRLARLACAGLVLGLALGTTKAFGLRPRPT